MVCRRWVTVAGLRRQHDDCEKGSATAGEASRSRRARPLGCAHGSGPGCASEAKPAGAVGRGKTTKAETEGREEKEAWEEEVTFAGALRRIPDPSCGCSS